MIPAPATTTSNPNTVITPESVSTTDNNGNVATTFPYIRGNVLYSATGQVNAVLPMITSQQNILIQRSKNINSQFSSSVKNVPLTNITILASFQPAKYVANSTEMGVYLPVISPTKP